MKKLVLAALLIISNNCFAITPEERQELLHELAIISVVLKQYKHSADASSEQQQVIEKLLQRSKEIINTLYEKQENAA